MTEYRKVVNSFHMSDESQQSTDNQPNTIYGVAVGMVRYGQVFLSRRTETVLYPKKWQFVNGRLKKGEVSVEAAMRVLADQTDIVINDRERFSFVKGISTNDHREFWFVYLVTLGDNDIPMNTCERFHGDWKPFDLERAEVLDVVDGIRPILRKMKKTKLKFETYLKSASGILSEKKRQEIVQLGPKMTRLL